MASQSVEFRKLKIDASLDALLSLTAKKQLWWILDEGKRAISNHQNAQSLCDQIGIPSTEFAAIYGARWKNKVFGSTSSFTVEMLNKCRFATTSSDPPDLSSEVYVTKGSARVAKIRRQIVADVQPKLEAFIEGKEADAETSDEATDTDRSIEDDRSREDTDTAMEEDASRDDCSSGEASADTSAGDGDVTTTDASTGDGGDTTTDASAGDAAAGETSTTRKRGREADISSEIESINEILFDEHGYLTADAAEALQLGLAGRTALTDAEKKVLGCLLQTAFKGNATKYGEIKTINKLSSFKCERPLTVARVPIRYKEKAKKSYRSIRRDEKSAEHWMDVFTGGKDSGFSNLFIMAMVDKNEELARTIVRRNSQRYTPEQTAVIAAHGGVNPYQVKKMARMMCHYSGGIRHFAVESSVAALKTDFFNSFHTMCVELVTMQRTVKTGRGNKALLRDQKVVVTKVRPAEHAIRSMNHLLNTKKFLPSKKRFTTPFRVHVEFVDVACIKMSCDAGGGSTKWIQNVINVLNPQGREHIGVAFEFSGVKDTAENIRRAAFQDGSTIKMDVEAMAQRRCVTLHLQVQVSGSDEAASQVILATNTDPNHNIYYPQPLQKFTGPVTTEQYSSMGEENKIGIVSMDFSVVASFKVLCCKKNPNTIIGLSFFNSDEKCIASSLFRTPIECKSITTAPIKMSQIVTCGVICQDMDLMSKFIGHQGASAKRPCIHCLVQLNELLQTWNADRPNHNIRTMEAIKEDYRKFKSMFESQPARLKTANLRKNVTQNHSHSIATEFVADVPEDTLLRALLHIRLGLSRTLLDWVFDFYLKVELLHPGQGLSLFREYIEAELNRLVAYDAWLAEELSDFEALVDGQAKQMDVLMDKLGSIRTALALECLSDKYRKKYEKSVKELEVLRKELQESMQGTDDELSYSAQLMEQQQITNDSISHLTRILKKHEGHTQRLIVKVLKKHGVDIQVYFSGVINGPHCFTFAQKGTEILADLTKEMLDIITDGPLRVAIQAFKEKMDVILSLWYKLMRFLTRVGCHSKDEIKQFDVDVEAMRVAIVDLIVDAPPLEGGNNPLKLPTTIKSHCLFGGDVKTQLDGWACTGGMDEQNGETTHTVFNQLNRQFGNTRGVAKKVLMFKGYHWNSCSMVQTEISDVMKATSRKFSNGKMSAPTRGSADEPDFIRVDQTPRDDNGTVIPATLEDFELTMNQNASLRGPTDPNNVHYNALHGMNTDIVACPTCRQRFLGPTMYKIHCQEIHNTSILAELDGEEETIKTSVR